MPQATETPISSQPIPVDVPPQKSLRQMAIRGGFWTVAGFGTGQLIRLIGNLVLTRLLAPELFGLMALAQLAMAGISFFSDIGATASVIRHPQGEDPRFLGTAWTLQFLRGCWIQLGSILVAYPLSRFYGDERLALIIPLVGLYGIAYALSSSSLMVLNRRLEVKTLALFEIGTQAATLLIMILIVLIWPQIWGLLLGQIVGGFLRTAASHFLRPRQTVWFAWDKSAVAELFSFGKWVFLSTAATFLGDQSDRLVLGKLFTLELLGIYNVAVTFAELPRQVCYQLNAKVTYPAISRVARHSREELRQILLRNRFLPLMAVGSMLAFFVGLGDFIIEILYDARYHQAAWMLPVLAAGLWPRVLSSPSESALMAVGKPQYTTIGNIGRFLAILIGLPLAFKFAGVSGVVIAAAFRDVAFYSATLFGLEREKLGSFRQDVMLTGLFLMLLGLILAIRIVLGVGTPLDALLLPLPA